jgi:anti-anti-sigma factor
MTLHCGLSVAKTDAGYVVRVQGNGTATDSPALADFVAQSFEQQPDACLEIDLLGCDYLDSTFLGCLLKLQRADQKDRFKVVADSATTERLLAATRLHLVLNLIDQASSTTSPFTGIDPKSLSDHQRGRHMMETHQALSEVPSEAAAAFGRIAEQLKKELDQQQLRGIDPDDTVIAPMPRK